MKRKDYISWHELFMGIAKLVSQRSKDPSTQVGACIVSSDREILSVGYNRFPKSCGNGGLPWKRKGDFLDVKYTYIIHAEMCAIIDSNKDKLDGATIYVTLAPCNECAKAIIQSGIKQVFFLGDKYTDTDPHIAARKLFALARVDCVQLKFSSKKLEIDLE